MKKLKIATFVGADVPFPLPKDFNGIYAPVEVAMNIAEGLTKKGHEVTFFGPKGSKSKAFKVKEIPIESLYKNKILKGKDVNSERDKEKIFYLFDQYIISAIFKENLKEKFDIIHIHPIDRVLPFTHFTQTPIVYTLHDPIFNWRGEIYKMYEAKNGYYVSISDAQRKPAPNLKWAGTVYNGIDINHFNFNSKLSDGHLLFVGRLLSKKGPHTAIKAAIMANENLIIFGTPNTGIFWKTKIKPYINNKNIKYGGFARYDKISEIYGKAKALLCPIDWEEPFGLTFIEAMACGTPVIAFDRGSASEVIKDGKTGYVVKDLNGMVKAIKKIDQIDRNECRKWVEEKFTVEKMVDDYEKVYYKILK